MLSTLYTPWIAGAATFAAAFLFTRHTRRGHVRLPRLLRLAGLGVLVPLLALTLAPAATFAASVRPTENVAARVSVALVVDGPADLAPGSAFSYKVTVTNDGPGAAENTRVDLPLDANVMIDDFMSGDPSIFVQTLNADMISIQFNELGPASVTTVTIMAHIRADAPAALTLNSRATVNWNDVNLNRISQSDPVALIVGTGAVAAPAVTQPLQIAVDGPVDAGTALTVTSTFYAADEPVSLWINTPAGITLAADSLGQSDSTLTGTVVGLDAIGRADDSGLLTYILDTTGLPSGTYSLVAHGWTSGLEGVASFTIK
jgi:hypothetical protein